MLLFLFDHEGGICYVFFVYQLELLVAYPAPGPMFYVCFVQLQLVLLLLLVIKV
jgi:hypothetical protein